ncbi:hypothetical protein GCM10010308_63220 [Streptomyces vinaceusdrappus]|nr:hypothetical protein GCM10010301_63180 [Streptomyces plicatus]GHC36191.1 hypothetical protein GCM10010308_63220 [Streptomyces vinaceusdrappus]
MGAVLRRGLTPEISRWSPTPDYQLLQTTAGGASDRLCQAKGLTDLGFVCTATV